MKRIDPATAARGNPGAAIRIDWQVIEERIRAGRRLHAEAVTGTFARVWRHVPALFSALFVLAALLAVRPATAAEGSLVNDPSSRLVAVAHAKPQPVAAAAIPQARTVDARELDALIEEGESLEQDGKLAEALIPFYTARNQARGAGQQPLVMLLDYRIAGAHWRLYEQTRHPAQLSAAIRHWESERDSYAALNYPPSFRGLVLYDLAGGYLALAAHEDLSANLGRAAQILKETQRLLEGDVTARVQHILASRTQPAAR